MINRFIKKKVAKSQQKSLHIIEINSIIISIDCMYGVSIVKSVLIGVKNKINE